VSVRVAAPVATSNYSPNPVIVPLGQYEILPPAVPTITQAPRDTTVRINTAATLTVVATSPNAGTLSYQWYRVGTEGAQDMRVGTNSATFTVPTGAVGVNSYYVQVTNSKQGEQVPDSTKSANATVTVLPAAINISSATVTIGGSYIYTGTAQQPTEITVMLDGAPLQNVTQYVIDTVTNNINAGTAMVRIRGVDGGQAVGYTGTALGTFQIARKIIEASDVTFTRTVQYNAAAQPIVITVTGGRTGLGVAAITYDGAAAVPTNAGTYEIAASFAQGQNFTATDSAFDLGNYTITQKVPVVADLIYTPFTDDEWTGEELGIGSVGVQGTGYGNVIVLYNGVEALPVDSGTYVVTVQISGGVNYTANVISLGSYSIKAPVSVKGNDRVVPGTNDDVAVVVPKTPTGSFTVGPNVVAKGDKVTFFWDGKALASGNLFVFDAMGNRVAKVNVTPANREIGSWVAKTGEGAYSVKGVLKAIDGTTTKVNAIISVR